ncbi:MAG TPA: hypothetical protein VHO90_21270, partial [Bacteroidales bacterium]|nr:hypothetical protein [Bacteroidales bacterium]
MNKAFYFLLLFLCCGLTLEGQYLMNLRQGEGILPVKDTARIDFNIPFAERQVVLVSLDGELLPEDNGYSIRLYDASGNAVKMYGGWYLKNRMSYFVTSGKTQKYKLVISPDKGNQPYTVHVKVDHVIAPFEKLDSRGTKSDLYTYLISNSPEELKPTEQCMGDDGFYLVRSKLQGNANVYWEHCNDIGHEIKFGVLLWNKDSKPVKIKINASSAKSWTECNGMEGAMCGVWHDWFANKRNNNEVSDSLIEIPPFTGDHPSASAKWIFLCSTPPNDPVKSTFNGLVNLSITNSDGSLYAGDKVFCDAYALSPGKENQVLRNIAMNDIAPTSCTLRGSGPGAMLEANIQPIRIDKNTPYRFLITGFDPPFYQKGENTETYFYNKSGELFKLPTHYGYSVVYKFCLSKIQSKNKVKAGFRMHPNSFVDKWAGIYAIAKRERDGQVLSKQVLVTQNDVFVFDPEVPLNEPVTYYLVISGMSSLPVEVLFF